MNLHRTSKSPAIGLTWLRRCIWLYIWLLIFEGAVRKWVAPSQLNGLIAISRDPVVILIYALAYRSKRVESPSFLVIAIVGVLMTLLGAVQVALEIITLPVVLFGLRSYILHLPLIFVIEKAITPEDLRKLGRFFMFCSIPMALLVITQFRAGPSDRLNAGAGEGSRQIEGALGHIRPAGTFSYGTGVSEFFPLVEAFAIANIFDKRKRSKWLAIFAVCATLAVIPFSLSRTLMFWSFLVAAVAAGLVIRKTGHIPQLIALLAGLGLCGVALSQLGFVDDSIIAFTTRWNEAKGDQLNQGGGEILVERLVNPVFDAFDEWQKTPFWGQGLGLGSNFASAANTGKLGFLLAESEVIRLIQEAGPLIGVIFIAYRVFICFQMLYSAGSVARHSALPFVLTAATVPNLLFSGMEQPTNLGFMVLGAGLAFAAGTQERRARGRHKPLTAKESRHATYVLA